MDIILTFIGSGCALALFKIIDKILDKKNAKTIALNKLMLQYIENKSKEFINKGSISVEELKNYCEAYSCYKSLHGNGYADQLYESVCDLPKEAE